MPRPKFSLENKKVFVAGQTGLVGRAVLRSLDEEKCSLLSAPHQELDLTNQLQTYQWFQEYKPDVVVMAAGKVGGIGANASDRAGFLYDNLAMAQNVIHSAYQSGVQKLLYLGSSCIYPKEAEQPIQEESLLTKALEPTNEGYALAKIAGLKLCQYYKEQYGVSFISAMPTNLYGPYDHFDAEKSHVIPALILKIHQAKTQSKPSVTIWGSGKALREFLFVDDLSKAIICLLKYYDEASPINIGSGHEISIYDLVMMIKDTIGYEGDINFDTSKPDGTMRKIVDSARINKLGWRADISLQDGLTKTYDWFLQNRA